MVTVPDIRPSPIAGAWYSGNADFLRAEMRRFLDAAVVPQLPGEVIGLVSPHAGHRYSGRTAAHAFKAVQGMSYDLVVLAGPFHHYPTDLILTSAHHAYATPLGEVPIDLDALREVQFALGEAGMPVMRRIANDQEHSLEIELPFLQTVLEDGFKILPIMLATYDASILKSLGMAIAKLSVTRNILLVASTDLSHFYNIQDAKDLDETMLKAITSLDPTQILRTEQSRTGQACGAMAVAAILWAAIAMGANTTVRLHYSTSADAGAPADSVVGYGAVTFLKKGNAPTAS